MKYTFINISVPREVLGATHPSRRDVLSLWNLFGRRLGERRTARDVLANSLAIEAADTALQRREQGLASDSTTLVFRLDSSVNWAKHETLLSSIVHELSDYSTKRNPTNRQIVVFSRDYKHFLEPVYDPTHQVETSGAASTTDGPTFELKELQDYELRKYVSSASVLFEHGGTAFFQIPAGTFHDYFIRIGNTQSVPNFATSAFFWSLPYIKNVTTFFAESWSISTTAATFSSLQNLYAGSDVSRWKFAHSYFPGSDPDEDLLRSAMKEQFGIPGRFLLLNSFSSSGRLAAQFDQIRLATGAGESEMLSLFADSRVNEPHHSVLLDVAPMLNDLDLKGKADLPLPSGAPVFSVHPSTYFPDYRRVNPSKFRIGGIDYNKSFFERFSGKGIFSVNRRGRNVPQFARSSTPGSMRHHAFHVDAPKLFRDGLFREALKSALSERESPTVYLTNGTEAASELVDSCRTVLSQLEVPKILCNDPSYQRLVETEGIASIVSDPQQRLLIVVPLVISGSTLGNVQIKLRELERHYGAIKCNVSILVGLLRPSHSTKLKELKGLYLKNPANTARGWTDPVIVESIVLPNWQESQCPWQRERLFWMGVLDGVELSEDEFLRISSRANLLAASTNSGLTGSDVFYTSDGSSLRFNPKSLWLDDSKVEKIDFLGDKTNEARSSEADLCCAVASALQLWRESVRATDWRFNVVDASTVTNLNGFNEARLRAAIWRGLTAEELINTARIEDGSDLKGLLDSIFFGPINENYTPLQLEAKLSFRSEIGRCLGPGSHFSPLRTIGA
jgi:hypothetical protein